MIEIEVIDKSRSIISHFWIKISDKMIICSANVFDLISWMWGSTPDRCYYQQMSVRCFSSSKRLWHAFIRHTVTEIPGNFIFSYTHPETACTSSPHKYKHHIIITWARDSRWRLWSGTSPGWAHGGCGICVGPISGLLLPTEPSWGQGSCDGCPDRPDSSDPETSRWAPSPENQKQRRDALTASMAKTEKPEQIWF